jgi:hypothetical protein
VLACPHIAAHQMSHFLASPDDFDAYRANLQDCDVSDAGEGTIRSLDACNIC